MTNPDHQLEPDEPAGAASLDHQQQVPDKQTTQTDTSLQPESPPDPHVQGDNIGEEPPPSNPSWDRAIGNPAITSAAITDAITGAAITGAVRGS